MRAGHLTENSLYSKQSIRRATTQLSGHLGVPVKIGNVDIEWFNRLVLEGLYLKTKTGKSCSRQSCGGGIRDHAVTGREVCLHDGTLVRFLLQSTETHAPKPFEPTIRDRRFRQ